MKDAFKPVWGLLFILLGVIAVVFIAKARAPKELVPWRSDFKAAQADAAQSGKPMFVYFTASWCGPCQRMRTTTWADPQVEAALRGYVPVKVDVDSAGADLKRRYLWTPQNLRGGIPAFRVVDAQGEVKKEGTGALSPEEFLRWLGQG